MKKVFLLILGLYISLFCFKNNVSAADCEYGLQAPQIPQGYSMNYGPVVPLHTNDTQCKGVNTAVYFGSFGSLPNWYVPVSGTIVTAFLVEDDPPASEPDEVVKSYIGTFTGRTLTDFYLLNTITPGEIDSAGDQTCELYMSFSITGMDGGTPIPAGLFYYSMCMN